MKNNFLKLLSVLFVALALPVFAGQFEQIGWNDLKKTVEFDDPFENLPPEQLMELSVFARILQMKAVNPDKVSDAMQAEADQAELSLKKQGVDIEVLLAKRLEIMELRKKRANAMYETLDGTSIRMAGYALPLEYFGQKVTEFLLVPWVGACIHTPPPSPNQIVHVKLENGFEISSRYEPVWVSGVVAVGNVEKSLYLVDGTADINIGYSINKAGVEKYWKVKEESTLSKVSNTGGK